MENGDQPTPKATRRRKRPVVIEAMQFDGTGASQVAIKKWAGSAVEANLSSRWMPDVIWTPRHWEFGISIAMGRYNIFGRRRRSLHLMFGPVTIGVFREAVRNA